MRILSTLLLLLFPTLLAAQGLKITPLAKDLYVFTTWVDYGGSPFPANGMYALTKAGAVLLDSPWDTTQTQALLDTIRMRHGMEVRLCVGTHAHEDRTGAFDQLRRQGIPTYTSVQTRAQCAVHENPMPQHVFLTDTSFKFGGLRMEWHYPGPGHTSDNIVVWLPARRVLYGGCLVKSVESKGLGNIADADLQAWPTTMQGLLTKYANAAWVIPGHQAWSPGTKALQHTVQLLEKAAQKQK
jgi:glyoxylase-like metal-dependent hydrolase (beta-lactamase superfamily II)